MSDTMNAAAPGREVSYAVQVQGESSTHVHLMHDPEGSHSNIHNFTVDKVQCLLSLIETPKAGLDKLPGKKPWCFDSGASYHMTGDVDVKLVESYKFNH